MSEELQAQVEKSRESAARLLDSLAQKVGGYQFVRTVAVEAERASHYVPAQPLKEVAAGIDRAVRRRPASAIALAVVAGFLVGRVLRSR